MRNWRHIFSTVTGLSLGLPALLAVCLFLLPVCTAPFQPKAKGAGSGMDAPPPAALESFRTLGSWGSAERRVLGSAPERFGLQAPAPQIASAGLLAQPVPTPTKDTLALLGQWRLEGG